MTKITTFDRKTLGGLQDDIVRELEAFCASRGITIRAHGGTLGDEPILKFKFSTEAAAADPTLTTEGKMWAVAAPNHGIAADAVGKWFTDGRDEYLAMGWNYAAPKRPILIKSKRTGNRMVANVAWFKSLRPVAAA